jgi:hypothetical protein
MASLQQSILFVSLIQVDDPDYDLLSAIRHQWESSTLPWKVKHIKDHQDDHAASYDHD